MPTVDKIDSRSATALLVIERRVSFGHAKDARSTYTGIMLSDLKVQADAVGATAKRARMGCAGDVQGYWITVLSPDLSAAGNG